MHCIRVSKAKLLLFDEDFREAVDAVRPEFAGLELPAPLITASYSGSKAFDGEGKVQSFVLAAVVVGTEGACRAELRCFRLLQDVNLNVILPTMPSERLPRKYRASVKPSQPFALVYTSGATTLLRDAQCAHRLQRCTEQSMLQR